MQMQMQQPPEVLLGFIAGAATFANVPASRKAMPFPASSKQTPLAYMETHVHAFHDRTKTLIPCPPKRLRQNAERREASERTYLRQNCLGNVFTQWSQTASSRVCLISASPNKQTSVFSRLRLFQRSPTSDGISPPLRFGYAPGRSRNFVLRLQSRSRRD